MNLCVCVCVNTEFMGRGEAYAEEKAEFEVCQREISVEMKLKLRNYTMYK